MARIDKVKLRLELALHNLCLDAERQGYLLRVDLRYDPLNMKGKPDMLPDVRPTRARMAELQEREAP